MNAFERFHPPDQELWHQLTSTPRRGPEAECPDELTLASYVDGQMAPVDVELLESHLCQCDHCLQAIAEVRQQLATGSEALTFVPRGTVDAAKALVSAPERVRTRTWAMAVRWTGAAAACVLISLAGWHAGTATTASASLTARGSGQDVARPDDDTNMWSELTLGVLDDAEAISGSIPGSIMDFSTVELDGLPAADRPDDQSMDKGATS